MPTFKKKKGKVHWGFCIVGPMETGGKNNLGMFRKLMPEKSTNLGG